jgi:hypothetical protein
MGCRFSLEIDMLPVSMTHQIAKEAMREIKKAVDFMKAEGIECSYPPWIEVNGMRFMWSIDDEQQGNA